MRPEGMECAEHLMYTVCLLLKWITNCLLTLGTCDEQCFYTHINCFLNELYV